MHITVLRAGFVTVAIHVDQFYVITTAKGFNPRHAKKRLSKKLGEN